MDPVIAIPGPNVKTNHTSTKRTGLGIRDSTRPRAAHAAAPSTVTPIGRIAPDNESNMVAASRIVASCRFWLTFYASLGLRREDPDHEF
jgi:hypothetical protein